jgi:hypothetical protein
MSSNRDHLAYACIAAGIFWIAFYFTSRFSGAFGILALTFAAGNAIVVASIYGYIKPWRRQITNLAVADAVGVLFILFGMGSYVSSKLGSAGLQSFTIQEVLLGAALLALVAVLAVKSSYTWAYSRELKAAGVPAEAGKLPATLQIISGALLALFAGGCTLMLGGFSPNAADFPIIFLFGWLPLLGGLFLVAIGVRKLRQT